MAAAQSPVYEEEPHNYWTRPLDDFGSRLEKALAAGTLKLEGTGREVLDRLLAEWKIPAASQVLVFSKTSLQRDRIAPWTPRALYFNEECYVGWCPGGLLEVTTIDPVLGPIFYGLDPNRPERERIHLDRTDNCMNCHGGSMTGGVPGVFIRSVFTGGDGQPMLQAGSHFTDHTSPLEERWGGWYVTGTHGSVEHMGNATAEEKGGMVSLDTGKYANLRSLEKLVALDKYPAQTSDIVALMVLEHQVGMQSRLTEAAYDVRGAIHRRTQLLKELNEPVTDDLTGSALSVARSHVEKVLKCLLYAGEARLPEGGVEGDKAFRDAWRANRIEDSKGRSLKDFQLLDRMMKYRCSSLIYSRSWDALPAPFKSLLYTRLKEILTSPAPVKGYEHLPAGERTAILEILRETRKDLPEGW